MNRLTVILVLTMTMLLGSSGVCWSADFQKGLDAALKGDFVTALKEWRPLAEQGDADAQFNLGQMYSNGRGVIQDYKSALKWWTLAAEQGYAGAQFNLGVMYDNGEGVIQDNVYAHMWWNIAASSGHEEASKNRGMVAEDMTASQIAEGQTLARECVKKNYKGC